MRETYVYTSLREASTNRDIFIQAGLLVCTPYKRGSYWEIIVQSQ